MKKPADGFPSAFQHLEFLYRRDGIGPAVAHVGPDNDPVAIESEGNGGFHVVAGFLGLDRGAKFHSHRVIFERRISEKTRYRMPGERHCPQP